MMPLPFYLQQYFSNTGPCSSKIVHGSFFLQLQLPRCSCILSEICKSIIEMFWDKVFMVTNMVKKMENLDVLLLSVENEVLLTCNFAS